MAASPLARDVDTVRRFNRFYTRQIGVLQEKLLHSPFSLTEGRVLYEIGYHGDTGTPRAATPTAADVAKVLDLDNGYLSRILHRFVRRRLITRTPSDADARQAHLALTDRGRAALVPLQQLARDEVAVMLRHLSPADRGRVLDAMRLIRTIARRPRPRRDPRQAPGATASPSRYASTAPAIWAGLSRARARSTPRSTAGPPNTRRLRRRSSRSSSTPSTPRRERCWVAERDAAPVGAVMIVRQSDDVAKLRLLHVERAARGLGIGRRLVGECVRFSRAAGYGKIALWTQSNLLAARHLYQAAGFSCVAQEPHHRFGKDLVAETWELVL